MLGKADADIESQLGRPGLKREELGAQVWQYADQSCVLLLYLYKDDKRRWRVTHAESRRKNSAADQSATCNAST